MNRILPLELTAESGPPLAAPSPRPGFEVVVGPGLSVKVPAASTRRSWSAVGMPRALFIVAATLAHIGRLQACFKAIHADGPEEARAICNALQKIKLPRQYEDPPRVKRR